jgi:hypothetical protein
LALITFAEAFATEEEDFGILHQAIGDGCSNGGVVQDVTPLGEGCVGCNDGATAMSVASGYDLVEEIGSLLVESNIAKFVHDDQRWIGIDFEFADQGVIDLGSGQLIEHVGGGGKQDTLVGLTGAPTDCFGQETLADARIANQYDVGSFGDEVEIEPPKNAFLAAMRDL